MKEIMKGILIIDKIPEYCDEHCKFCDSFFNCQLVGDVEEAWMNKQRDSKCHIKPLPKEKEDLYFPCNEYIQAFNEGYNKCIDDILGEEEC